MRKQMHVSEKNKKAAGFTLIELMIVVAIIGVLASLAVPAYGRYVMQAKMSEALAITQQAKVALITWHSTHGEFLSHNHGDVSDRNLEIGLARKEAYKTSNVEAMWIGLDPDPNTAHIVVALNSTFASASITGDNPSLRSTVSYVDGSYVFDCNIVWYRSLKNDAVPASCRK